MLTLPAPFTRSAIALALLATLSGCYIVPARPYYGGEQRPPVYANEAPIPEGPPPPRDEVYGVAPALGWLWLGGYWGWNLGRHVWIGGHWEAPRVGQYWVPHRWAPVRGGWHLNQGYWARR